MWRTWLNGEHPIAERRDTENLSASVWTRSQRRLPMPKKIKPETTLNDSHQTAMFRAQESAHRAAPRDRSQAIHRILRVVISYGVAAGCLAWVFHDLDFHALLKSLRQVDWWYLLPAVLLVLSVYFIAGWEWQILLRPAARISIPRTTQAVFAGRFANDVLPVHVGYVVRLFLISRWTGAKIAAIAPSLMVERLLDGFWLALGIGVTAIFFPLPGRIAEVAEIWAGIITFGIVATGFILFRKPKSNSSSPPGILRWRWLRISAGRSRSRFARSDVRGSCLRPLGYRF